MLEKRPRCVILDIDGLLIWQCGLPGKTIKKGEVIPGTIEKLWEWDGLGYRIILITARRESLRKSTENMLMNLGIFYDTLVMDAGCGERVLVNDLDPKHPEFPKAIAVNVERNKGISQLQI